LGMGLETREKRKEEIKIKNKKQTLNHIHRGPFPSCIRRAIF
jgi:hypothetical protein